MARPFTGPDTWNWKRVVLYCPWVLRRFSFEYPDCRRIKAETVQRIIVTQRYAEAFSIAMRLHTVGNLSSRYIERRGNRRRTHR